MSEIPFETLKEHYKGFPRSQVKPDRGDLLHKTPLCEEFVAYAV
jgi:hypothetical protein